MKLRDHMFGGFHDEERDQEAEVLLAALISKRGTPEVGTTRAVFIGKHHVFKFPINDAGERANDWEGSARHDTYARGRWVCVRGFVCVMQERLTPVSGLEPLPDWTGSIDGAQVGYDRHGNLKAYDFG